MRLSSQPVSPGKQDNVCVAASFDNFVNNTLSLFVSSVLPDYCIFLIFSLVKPSLCLPADFSFCRSTNVLSVICRDTHFRESAIRTKIAILRRAASAPKDEVRWKVSCSRKLFILTSSFFLQSVTSRINSRLLLVNFAQGSNETRFFS